MKLLSLLFFALAIPAQAQITVGVHTFNGSSDTITVTAPASAGTINTTGHPLIFIGVADDVTQTAQTPTDSAANTWTALTTRNTASVRLRTFYCNPCTTSATHTFSYGSGASRYPSICVVAFTGTLASSPFDQQNGATTDSATSLATGSVTPTTNGQVVATAIGLGDGGTMSINGGFSITDQLTFNAGTYFGVGCATLVQTTATAANPTWTFGATGAGALEIATFKATATGSSTIGGYLRRRRN